MLRWPTVCVLVTTLLARPSDALTVIPLSIAELTQSSQAVVIADVTDISGELGNDGHIHTLVRIVIAEVIAGQVDGDAITLYEVGGSVDDEVEVVDAAPHFVAGERAVLFLARRDDGLWHTNQMLLGKFTITAERVGVRASQPLPASATVLLPPGVNPPPGFMDLDALVDTIRAAASGSVPPAEPDWRSDQDVSGEVSSAFQLGGTGLPGRFFEPDLGGALSFLIDQRGDSILGLATSRRAVDAAFAAWTNVDSATIELRDSGLTTDLSPVCPGPNPLVVRFDDPLSEIPAPIGCHGMLAVGGFRARNSETKVFNNTTFGHSLCATLTFADGWGSCDVWTECNIGEIATHEIGHTIGLAHSSDRNPEPDATLRDATMYFQAHFDGRCAAVRSDDIAGATFIYPLEVPPSITTPDVLPPGVEGQPYLLQLAGTGGAGSFSWSLTRQTNLTGLAVSSDGVLSGNPASSGSGTKSLLIRAADVSGDAHTKLFTLVLFTPPPSATGTETATPTATLPSTETPTTTATPTASITPTATDTASVTPTSTPTAFPSATSTSVPSPTPLSCPGDCDRSGEVTIDEIITLVNIALGDSALDSCRPGDVDGSGEITIDEVIAAVNAALIGCVPPR